MLKDLNAMKQEQHVHKVTSPNTTPPVTKQASVPLQTHSKQTYAIFLTKFISCPWPIIKRMPAFMKFGST